MGRKGAARDVDIKARGESIGARGRRKSSRPQREIESDRKSGSIT